MQPVSTLKAQLRSDLTAAMKARDEVVKSTLRMTLTAIGNAEVAGTQARELDDDEVAQGDRQGGQEAGRVGRGVRRRRARGAGRAERAEGEVLARYLPTQLTDDELAGDRAHRGGGDRGRDGAEARARARWVRS